MNYRVNFRRTSLRALMTAALLAVFALGLFQTFSQTFSQTLHAGPVEEKQDASRMWREIERTMPLSGHNLLNGRILLKYREKINLTPKQVEKIETLMMEYESFYISKTGEIKSKELRFAFYLRSGKKELDRKEMAKYIREISSIKTDVIVTHVNYLLDLKNLLTPQQRKTLETLEEARRKQGKKTAERQK